jgi:hypothetical protein
MKKILFLIGVISLVVLTGAGCVSVKIEDREKPEAGPSEEPIAPPEANVNREIPPLENINAPIDTTSGWEVFRDEPWALEIKYPPKYKTVHDTYGWPHALIHFVEVAGAQSYRAQIETWDNEGDFRATYSREPAFIAEHPNGKNWVTIDYNSDPSDTILNDEWRTIISTFRFTAP